MIMKKILSIMVSMIMLLSCVYIVFADESEIRVQQNGEYIDFTDNAGNVVNPQIINSRTMVPFRKIFNSLGVTDENIMWDDETKTVIAKKDNIEIELQINNMMAKKTISGNETIISLDSAPVIIEGRTLVPVRFIAESMNKKVGWDAENRTVIIIDTEKIYQELENSIQKYLQLLNEEPDDEIFSNKMTLKGKINYTSKENKADNSSLELSGTININNASEAVSTDANIKITGKGSLYDSLKENKFTTLSFHSIFNENKILMKNTFLDNKTNGKWAYFENDMLNNFLANFDEEEDSFKKIFEVDENVLNIDTYDSLNEIVKIIQTLYQDENIQITEKGSNKTYTISIKISDITPYLKSIKTEYDLSKFDGIIKYSYSTKKGVPQSDILEVNFEYVEDYETLKGSIKAEGTITNKKSNITIPTESQTININEI